MSSSELSVEAVDLGTTTATLESPSSETGLTHSSVGRTSALPEMKLKMKMILYFYYFLLAN